jgi:hypothetical protein
MRLLLDANVLLDCLILEQSGEPRQGRDASEAILDLCDQGVHDGLVAWHTLPIIAHYHRKQHSAADTATMINDLLALLQVPTVGHADARDWQSHQIADFEDALQVSSALAGKADVLLTRNVADFSGASIPVMTPEDFLRLHP